MSIDKISVSALLFSGNQCWASYLKTTITTVLLIVFKSLSYFTNYLSGSYITFITYPAPYPLILYLIYVKIEVQTFVFR